MRSTPKEGSGLSAPVLPLKEGQDFIQRAHMDSQRLEGHADHLGCACNALSWSARLVPGEPKRGQEGTSQAAHLTPPPLPPHMQLSLTQQGCDTTGRAICRTADVQPPDTAAMDAETAMLTTCAVPAKPRPGQPALHPWSWTRPSRRNPGSTPDACTPNCPQQQPCCS
jgi:hypothetical protein